MIVGKEPAVAEIWSASYYRARYYDQSSGRFISEDPIRWSGGSNDFYAYVRSNAVNLRDPYGLWLTYIGDISNWAKALSYLRLDPGMAGIIAYLSTISEDLKIVETAEPCGTDSSGGYDPKTRTIYWNPHCAYACEHGGAGNSPACVLGHELGHAALNQRIGNFASHYLSNSPGGAYGNLNEMYVIAGPENNFAIHLGECVRSSHSSPPSYLVPNPKDK